MRVKFLISTVVFIFCLAFKSNADSTILLEEAREIAKIAASQKTTPQYCYYLGQAIHLQKKVAMSVIAGDEKKIRPKVMIASLKKMSVLAEKKCGIKE